MRCWSCRSADTKVKCAWWRRRRTLIAAGAAYPDRDRLGVIGSGYREFNNPLHVQKDAIHGDNWEEVASVVTSGSLIPLKTHVAVGAFREDFFIDHVDTEYCFRARAKGYRVIRTRRPIMSHSIGAISRHEVLWMKKWTFNHAAERRYYIARNDTVMLREFGHYIFGLWALKSFGRCVRLCKRIALYEEMKTSKIVAVAQGWWDGVRGRMGPRPHRQRDRHGSQFQHRVVKGTHIESRSKRFSSALDRHLMSGPHQESV